MKNKQILPLVAAAIALPIGSVAASLAEDFVNFGPSTTYVTATQNLIGGNGGFNQTSISPSSGYTGPAFWGGITYNVGGGASTWAVMDNYGSAGALDAIRGARFSMAAGDRATYVFMFGSSADFRIDNIESSFSLNARRDGGQNGADTGIRWLLQDTSNNYFVSQLNNSAAAQFASAYSSGGAVTQGALLGLTWHSYTFGTATVGSAIADNDTFFNETLFKAAGFQYTAGRVTSGGGIDVSFSDFTVTAIPEPSTYAAIVGIAILGLAILRRRRGRV